MGASGLLTIAVPLVLMTLRVEAAESRGRTDTSDGYCKGYFEPIPVGGTGYDDERCERILCADGFYVIQGCGVVSIRGFPSNCKLVGIPGHYPNCCKTNVDCNDASKSNSDDDSNDNSDEYNDINDEDSNKNDDEDSNNNDEDSNNNDEDSNNNDETSE